MIRDQTKAGLQTMKGTGLRHDSGHVNTHVFLVETHPHEGNMKAVMYTFHHLIYISKNVCVRVDESCINVAVKYNETG